MARPPSIKDEQILEAARQVFLAKGISATTAEVARRAGIAEGSIFNRFPTKHELFKAAMRGSFEEPAWLATLAARAGKEDPRETLVAVGLEAIAYFRTFMPLMMMSWSNPTASGLPEQLTRPDPPPLRALQRFTALFAAEMKGRQVRKHDPEVAARAFLGSLQSFVFLGMLQTFHARETLDPEVFLRGLVALLWTGLQPKGPK